MPDGTHMAGPADLHKALAARGPQLVQTITEKLMTYAVGRPMDLLRHAEPCAASCARLRPSNYRFESIVLGVVNSDAFRKRAPAAPLPTSLTTQASNLTTAP